MSRPRKHAVTLPPELHARAQAFCRATGVPMADWVEAWLTVALEAPQIDAAPPPPPRTVAVAALRSWRAQAETSH